MHTLPFTTDQLLALLPHGSGIDAEWELVKHTPYTYRFNCEYHHMNEAGYYTHWSPFGVIFSVNRQLSVRLLKGPCVGKVQIIARPGDTQWRIVCRNAGLKEYLYDVVGEAVAELVPARMEVIYLDQLEGAQYVTLDS